MVDLGAPAVGLTTYFFEAGAFDAKALWRSALGLLVLSIELASLAMKVIVILWMHNIMR